MAGDEFLGLTNIDKHDGAAECEAWLQFNNLDPCRRIHQPTGQTGQIRAGLRRDRPSYWPDRPLADRRTGGEDAVLKKKTGSIVYRFHARDLHLVLGPAPKAGPVRFHVTIVGAAPGNSHGADVDADGQGVVTGQRLYQRQSGAITGTPCRAGQTSSSVLSGVGGARAFVRGHGF